MDLHKSTAKSMPRRPMETAKRETKATKSKKKTGKQKYAAFHNGQDDCTKDSVALPKSFQIQELRDLINRIKK
jgi:hypothetical protein